CGKGIRASMSYVVDDLKTLKDLRDERNRMANFRAHGYHENLPEGDCSPFNGVTFICGVTNVEDLILVPNTKWVIGSGFTDQVTTQNYLHLFDTETETGAAVQ